MTRKRLIQRDMDMTAMVDVSFLLLIFFMVTASFTVQKALGQPPVQEAAGDTTGKASWIEVEVDRFNSYRLIAGNEFVDAASDQEMRLRLQDLASQHPDSSLRILPDGNAWHEKVVAVWDAGHDNLIGEIRIELAEN